MKVFRQLVWMPHVVELLRLCFLVAEYFLDCCKVKLHPAQYLPFNLAFERFDCNKEVVSDRCCVNISLVFGKYYRLVGEGSEAATFSKH